MIVDEVRKEFEGLLRGAQAPTAFNLGVADWMAPRLRSLFRSVGARRPRITQAVHEELAGLLLGAMTALLNVLADRDLRIEDIDKRLAELERTAKRKMPPASESIFKKGRGKGAKTDEDSDEGEE